MSEPTIALAHEWLDLRTGSEKVFEALARMFPDADLYALTDSLGDRFDHGGRPVTTTFLDRAGPLAHRRDLALPLMPLAWRNVTRRRYDVVITSSHACAKGFGPGRDALHLCYCYTPMRYVWDENDQRHGLHRLGRLGAGAAMRRWDRRSTRWVDGFAAISTAVQARIERCYGRSSRVIHPPVDTSFFTPGDPEPGIPSGDFLLTCSRFVPYKRLDLAILAADRVGLPLVIAGQGPGEGKLRVLAGEARVPVTFAVGPSDEELRSLYRAASAFVFPPVEDFGIVAVEAQACGTPVVALRAGGALDTVVDGKTGTLVGTQDAESFAAGVEKALADVNRAACVQNASSFSHKAFEHNVRDWVHDAVNPAQSAE
jgi:glycosyltransferase involved in cell wall biosynthesis